MPAVAIGLPVWEPGVWDAVWEDGVWASSGPVVGPTITTSSLPDGTVGVPYSQTLTATGGTLPYAWSITSGSLPTGLTLHTLTGVIDGTPTVAGVFAFTVKVTDALLASDTQPLSITIPTGDPVITTTSLPSWVVNVAGYSATVHATGGVVPYDWTVDTGSLPTGLTLHNLTGVIDGTPTVAGTYDFVIKVTDNNANTDTQPLRIVIFGAGGGSSQTPPESRNRGRYRDRDKHKG